MKSSSSPVNPPDLHYSSSFSLSFRVCKCDIEMWDLYIFLIYRVPDSLLLPWYSLVTTFTLWFLWRLKTKKKMSKLQRQSPSPLYSWSLITSWVCVSELCASLILHLCPSGRNPILFVSSGAPRTLLELHEQLISPIVMEAEASKNLPFPCFVKLVLWYFDYQNND